LFRITEEEFSVVWENYMILSSVVTRVTNLKLPGKHVHEIYEKLIENVVGKLKGRNRQL
jgi:hypothetical protein